MRILIVDDDSQRHIYFARQYAEHEVISVYSYYEACDALRGDKFDVVQLDHDLGDFREPDRERDMYGSVELTGYHVAHYIATVLPVEKRPNKIIVHSVNSDGATSIVRLLERHSIYPVRQPFILR